MRHARNTRQIVVVVVTGSSGGLRQPVLAAIIHLMEIRWPIVSFPFFSFMINKLSHSMVISLQLHCLGL